jgi:hypothetical protein
MEYPWLKTPVRGPSFGIQRLYLVQVQAEVHHIIAQESVHVPRRGQIVEILLF